MLDALSGKIGHASLTWSLSTSLTWWLLPPLVVTMALTLWWLHRRDLRQLTTTTRHTLSGLRLLTATVLLLLAWQPALVQTRTQYERPWLLLAEDRSASMQALDLRPDASARLDAAQGLGLFPSNARPAAARRARSVVDTIVAQRDQLSAAVSAGASARWRAWCQTQAAALEALTPDLAGTADLGPRLTALERTLTTLAHGFAENSKPAVADAAAAWRSALAEAPTLLDALSAAQSAADAALLAGADATAPVAQAVAQVAALTRAQRSSAALRRLSTRLSPQADVAAVGFARDVVAVDGSPTGAPEAKSAAATSAVPLTDGTDFSAVLTYATRDWSADRPLAAVVVLSDGRQSGGKKGAPAARALAHRGAWLATVAIGDAQPPCDAVVAALDAPTEAQLGEALRLDARVRVTGLPGHTWQATLSADGKAVAQRSLVDNDAWQALHFEHTPSTPGLHRYRVDLAATDVATGTVTPEASLANNHADAVVVVSAAPMRALIVDATPRWETRYLATVIARQSGAGGARVDSRFVLGQTGGAGLGAELDDYDLLVLGDLTPDELDAEAQTRCEHFVARRGGCVVVISGPRGMPARYGLGGLAELLPVRGAAVAPERPAMVGVTLTAAGATHPITTLLDDPALNRRLWPLLPPVSCVAPGLTAKPEALVLLSADDRARSPLLVVSEHGAGRVLWLGTDETWRWRAGLGDRLQQTFWQQALRYGLGSRLRGRDARLQLAVERAVLSPGELLEVRARVRIAGAHPRLTLCALDDRDTAGPERELTLNADSSRKTLEKSDKNTGADLWQATIANLGEGRWRLTLSVTSSGTSGDAELQMLSETRDVVVRGRTGSELAELAADPAQLTRLAQAGDGQAYALGELDQLADELAQRLQPMPVTRARTWRLWAGWPAVVIATLLLSSEWLLRRRFGRS